MSAPPRPFLKKKSADTSGDLRAVALSAHNKAQDVWGKKKAAGANNVLDQIEPENVEAYALDFAIRKLWDLQRDGDELVRCAVPVETTKKLRAIVLEVLVEHQKRLTREHTFEISDPEVVEQREKEKRERAIANMKERQARREEVEREKRERESKMNAKVEEKKKAEQQQEEEQPEGDAAGKTEKKSRRKKKSKDGSRKRSKKDKDGGTESEEKEKTKKRKKKSSKIKTEGEGDEKKKEKKRRKTTADVEVNGSIKKSTPEETKAEEAPKSSARNRRRTVGTGAPRGPRPRLQRGGEVIVQEDPIPTITVTKTLVDLDALHSILEEQIRAEFPNLREPSLDNEFLEFYHLSVKGPRPSNEDEYCVVEHVNEWFDLQDTTDKYAYFGVYDGHSGKYTSLYTRSQLHKNLFLHTNFPDDEAFREAFNETDRCVNEFQHRNTFSCGTTALSVSIKNNKELIVGNVGDCRGFLCRDGKPYEIAVPHNLDREDEKKRIESLGGAVVCFGTWRVNGILAVSRSIGDYNLRALVISDPEVTRIELQKSDEFLVVASDGLWDGCTGEEMIEIVKRVVAENGREYVCKALCDHGIEKNTKDNVTVVAVFFNQDKAP